MRIREALRSARTALPNPVPLVNSIHAYYVLLQSLSAYLGIDVAATSIDCSNAAERLQLDDAKLLRRWAGLPIRLPSFLGDRINALSADHIAKVIDSSSGATTPLRLVRALECYGNRPELADHRAAIVARILEEWRARIAYCPSRPRLGVEVRLPDGDAGFTP